MPIAEENISEQLKQLAAEDERKKKEAANALSGQSERLPMTALGDAQKRTFLQDDTTSEVQISPRVGAYNQDWKAVVDAYKEEFKTGPDKNGSLLFASEEAATAFFKKRAEAGNKFLTTWLNSKGEIVDHKLFSCGDGKLYEGTVAEIQSELQAAAEEDPDNEMTQQGLAAFNYFFFGGDSPQMMEPIPGSMADPTSDAAREMREKIMHGRATTAKYGPDAQKGTELPVPSPDSDLDIESDQAPRSVR